MEESQESSRTAPPPCVTHLSGLCLPPVSAQVCSCGGSGRFSPEQASGRDCPPHPRCPRRGDAFHLVSPSTGKWDNPCLASNEGSGVEGDLAGLPQDKGLPSVPQEYSS